MRVLLCCEIVWFGALKPRQYDLFQRRFTSGAIGWHSGIKECGTAAAAGQVTRRLSDLIRRVLPLRRRAVRLRGEDGGGFEKKSRELATAANENCRSRCYNSDRDWKANEMNRMTKQPLMFLTSSRGRLFDP